MHHKGAPYHRSAKRYVVCVKAGYGAPCTEEDTVPRTSVTIPQELYDKIGDDVDYPAEKLADWIRDACRLRLSLENARELLDSDSADGELVEEV